MKYIKALKYILFVFIFIWINPSILIASENHLISSYEEDITGDGLHERIDLNGELLSDKSGYYRNIWLSIKSPFANEWKIPLKSGYKPRVQFIDLNHDLINDIFFSSRHSEHDNIFHYELYSLANGAIHKIPLPKQQLTKGHYKPNFKIGLKLSPYHEEISININRYKTDYINSNIYDDSGKVLKKTTPLITPFFHLEPVIISEIKGYGLKSVHYLKRLDGMHDLGQIETLWYYKNNSWIILQSKWHEKSS